MKFSSPVEIKYQDQETLDNIEWKVSESMENCISALFKINSSSNIITQIFKVKYCYYHIAYLLSQNFISRIAYGSYKSLWFICQCHFLWYSTIHDPYAIGTGTESCIF
jgi:cellobiose-specific phosphotransferase system component IIC